MTAPTVVLVHGAFADGSSWSGVIDHLNSAGLEAVAIANPLRGIGPDAAYLTSFVRQLDKPALLVGHSYGGALITQTGSDAANAVGLVFVAAFAPDTDEQLSAINARYPDVALAAALRTMTYPVDHAEPHSEAYIEVASFHAAFCADVPEAQARVLAATQRPVSLDAFTSVVTSAPAWRTLPSWAVVATGDQAIHPDAVRDMAKRAGSDIVEVEASHAVAVSKPEVVATAIRRAAEATS
ncbi:alpha/beta hydrolase [Intrasporangium mesophilum]